MHVFIDEEILRRKVVIVFLKHFREPGIVKNFERFKDLLIRNIEYC